MAAIATKFRRHRSPIENSFDHVDVLLLLFSVDVNAGYGLDLDAAEESREEELIAVAIVERERAITLLEAAELGSVRR